MLNVADQITEKSKNNYLTGDSSFLIDIIRVLACEMVVVSHIIYLYYSYFNLATNTTYLLSVIDNFLGHTGVILFFIVSGLVISNSLFKKMEDNNYRFMNFFIDRFSRIYSSLVPSLVFIFFCDLILLKINPVFFYKYATGLNILDFLGSLFMLQNLKIVGTQLPACAGVLWTLNIEWWLYLLFGWVILNFKRGIKMDAFFFTPLLLFAYYPLQRFLYDKNYENLPLVWFMGVAATIIYLYDDRKSWDQRLDYAILALIALIIGRIGLLIYISKTSFFDLTLEILLTLLLIMFMAKFKNTNRFDKTKIKSIIKFMAKYSFTLYLIHFVIEYLVFALYVTFGIKYPLVLVFIGAIVISNIIAIVIAYLTEMRYKELANFLNRFMKKNYTKENCTVNDIEGDKI